MHVSSARTMTSSSGPLPPVQPSVVAYALKIGAPSPSRMASRSSGVSVSLVLMTAAGV